MSTHKERVDSITTDLQDIKRQGITTPHGTKVWLEQRGEVLIVLASDARVNAATDVGYVIADPDTGGYGFIPPMFTAVGLGPATLRAIATLMEREETK